MRQHRHAFLVALLGLNVVLGNRASSEPVKSLIAVMIAYPPEMKAFVREFGLDDPKFIRIHLKGFPIYRGAIEGKDVIVVESGMSLVNAAMSLQLTLDCFPVTHVLVAGAGGGVDPTLRVGDIVIPERWAYHCEAAFYNDDGKGGYVLPKGLVPKYENFGMIFPRDVAATREPDASFASVPSFPADPVLLAVARKAVAQLGTLKGQGSGRILTIRIGGTGVSGPIFQDNAAYREHVFKVWNACCIEMESAAFAHVCYTNGVPFLAVRSLGDIAGAQKGENESDRNVDASSTNAYRVLRMIIRGI